MANRRKPKGEAPAKAVADPLDGFGNNAASRIISFVERIERLAEEIQGSQDDLKEVYSEAKGEGFDTAILRLVIRRRKMDPAKRQEMEAVLDLYEAAIGGRRAMPAFERAVQPGDTVDDEPDENEIYVPEHDEQEED